MKDIKMLILAQGGAAGIGRGPSASTQEGCVLLPRPRRGAGCGVGGVMEVMGVMGVMVVGVAMRGHGGGGGQEGGGVGVVGGSWGS